MINRRRILLEETDLYETININLIGGVGSGPSISVSYPESDGDLGFSKDYTWEGKTITIKIPTDKQVTIIYRDYGYYKSPANDSFITEAGKTRTINAAYKYITPFTIHLKVLCSNDSSKNEQLKGTTIGVWEEGSYIKELNWNGSQLNFEVSSNKRITLTYLDHVGFISPGNSEILASLAVSGGSTNITANYKYVIPHKFTAYIGCDDNNKLQELKEARPDVNIYYNNGGLDSYHEWSGSNWPAVSFDLQPDKNVELTCDGVSGFTTPDPYTFQSYSGGKGSHTFTYKVRKSKVYVSLACSPSDKLNDLMNKALIKITYDGNSSGVSQTWSGSDLIFEIPYNVNYTITGNKFGFFEPTGLVSGYTSSNDMYQSITYSYSAPSSITLWINVFSQGSYDNQLFNGSNYLLVNNNGSSSSYVMRKTNVFTVSMDGFIRITYPKVDKFIAYRYMGSGYPIEDGSSEWTAEYLISQVLDYIERDENGNYSYTPMEYMSYVYDPNSSKYLVKLALSSPEKSLFDSYSSFDISIVCNGSTLTARFNSSSGCEFYVPENSTFEVIYPQFDNYISPGQKDNGMRREGRKTYTLNDLPTENYGANAKIQEEYMYVGKPINNGVYLMDNTGYYYTRNKYKKCKGETNYGISLSGVAILGSIPYSERTGLVLSLDVYPQICSWSKKDTKIPNNVEHECSRYINHWVVLNNSEDIYCATAIAEEYDWGFDSRYVKPVNGFLPADRDIPLIENNLSEINSMLGFANQYWEYGEELNSGYSYWTNKHDLGVNFSKPYIYVVNFYGRETAVDKASKHTVRAIRELPGEENLT